MPNTFSLITSDRFDANFARNLFPYFDQEMSKRNYCIQHPYNDYITIVEEAYLSKDNSGLLTAKMYRPVGPWLYLKRTGFVSKNCYSTPNRRKQGSYKTFMPFGLTKP